MRRGVTILWRIVTGGENALKGWSWTERIL